MTNDYEFRKLKVSIVPLYNLGCNMLVITHTAFLLYETVKRCWCNNVELLCLVNIVITNVIDGLLNCVVFDLCVYRSLKPGWRIQMNMVSWWCRLVQEWSICQMTLLRNLLEPWAVYPRESSGGTAIHSFIQVIGEPFYQQIKSPAYSISFHSSFFYHKKVSIGNWYGGEPLISLWLQLNNLFSISKPVNPHWKWSDGLLDIPMVSKCKTSWMHEM